MQQHDLPRQTGAALTLLISATAFWVTAAHPVFADSHLAATPPANTFGYESALTGYKKLDGTAPSTWKESNDAVGAIGGWRAYANEAYKASQAPMEEGAVTTPIPESTATHLEAAPAKSTDTSATADMSKEAMPSAVRPAPLAVTYQSATTTHRAYDDNPPGDWRAANERVGEIGGWRTYAQEAYEASKRQSQKNDSAGAMQ